MNPQDYAIVVGISRYPGLGDWAGRPADLKAPDSDAQAVHAWLIDPQGGGLPGTNVRLFCSSQFPATNDVDAAEPKAENIRTAFRWLHKLAEANRDAGNDLQVGRRLYLYMSGHGFSPDVNRGSLYTANATTIDAVNCYASGWLNWFQDSGYFREFVLWMDCCMDRELTVTPEPTFRPRGSLQAAGPTFIGFAANRKFKTVERPIAADGGKVHGVFTWALLQGLKGAAPTDAGGNITGRTLSDYLINTMRGYLTADDLNDPEISKEPEIPRADAALVFGRGPASATVFPVQLRFAAEAVNQPAHLWSGPASAPRSVAIDSTTVELQLELGLHVVEVAGYRHGFEVNGSPMEPVHVSQAGPAVLAANGGGDVSLVVDPSDPTAEIFIVDHGLSLATQGRRVLSTWLPRGVYKVKVRSGGATTEQVLLLDRAVDLRVRRPEQRPVLLEDPTVGTWLPKPVLVSAAPLPGSAMSHEYHAQAASLLGAQTAMDVGPAARTRGKVRGPGGALPQGPTPIAGRGEIRWMARVWTGRGMGTSGAAPWAGVRLLNEAGEVLVDLGRAQDQFPGADGAASARMELPGAVYYLAQTHPDGREFQMALPVVQDWAVEVYMLALAGRSDGAQPGGRTGLVDRCAVLMGRKDGMDRHPGMDEVLESARVALMENRHILNAELEALLLGKFENPIAGILGAHLLIAEADRTAKLDRLGVLDEVVPNLRRLVGSDHPDVEAISLRCPSRDLRARGPFLHPPLFRQGWRLIVEASHESPSIVAPDLWKRIRATTNSSGYLIWASDRSSRAAQLRQVDRWIEAMKEGEAGPAGAEPVASASTMARALNIPFGVAASLWTHGTARWS